MYPIHTHLIKYKNAYLGKNNTVFGFVKEGHAKRVVEKLKYNTPILQVSPCTFVINRSPPKKSSMINRYIDKRHLQVNTFQTSVGNFFASVNNMELKLVDQVLVNRSTEAIILKCEFVIEEMVPLEPEDLVQHMDDVYNNTQVDYQEKMSSIIMDRYILEAEDDDFLE